MNIDTLKRSCRGRVSAIGDACFEGATHHDLWNELKPARVPQVVVRAADEDDIIAAIRFARENRLKVVVRGGGHNWCQPTLRNGGMLIDIGDLAGIVSVDVAKRKAVIRPIISNREIQRALNPKGLAFASGHCPQVKASGYLLGGGMAWNPTVWGSGAQNVETIELVTAQGELIRASENENPDYFWAARGAGLGFFGVVTKFHLRLHDLPRAIHGSCYYYCLNDAPAIGEWLGKLAPQLSRCIELSQFIVQAPEELKEAAASDHGWICMVTAVAFEETEEAAKAALRQLDDSPRKPLTREFATPQSFEQLFDASGALWPERVRSRVEVGFSNASPGVMMEEVIDDLRNASSPTTVFLFTIFCGPDVPVSYRNMAQSMSGKVYGGPWTMWTDEKDDQVNADWHAKVIAKLQPYLAGYYIGESNTVERPSNAVHSYTPENWQRLVDLREQYDPEGVFYGYFDGFGHDS